MITKHHFLAPKQLVSALHDIPSAESAVLEADTRRRRVWKISGATLTAVLVLGLTGSGPATGQPSALEIIPLAQGYSSEKHLTLPVKGPSDVLQSQLVFQPGGDTGWHIHPGPVVVVVKTGALTEYHCDGSIIVHPAGSVFFEQKDEVHRAVNQTGVVTEVYATFISPTGSQPLIPVSNTGPHCHN